MRISPHLPMLALLGLTLAAGCGGDDADDADRDGPDDSDQPATLAEIAGASSLALDATCVYVSTGVQIHCVARADGRPRLVGDLPPDLSAVEIATDGSAVFATALASDFGPQGDRQMRVFRFAAEGGPAVELGQVFAGFAAGQLVLDDEFVYVTTGGTADLHRFPKAGGAGTLLASDSGNFGDVAIVGDRLVYDNGVLYSVPLAGGDETLLALLSGEDRRVAAWGQDVISWGGSAAGQLSTSLVRVPLAGGEPVTLLTRAQLGGELAVAGDEAWLVVGADLVRVGLADGSAATVAAGELPVDVVADADAVYWITLGGQVRRLTTGG